MRNFLKYPGGLIVLCFIMAFTTMNTAMFRIPAKTVSLPIKEVGIAPIEVKVEPVTIEIKSHSAFLDAIGHKESRNNYKVVNTYGYMGRYQFGKATLKGLGFDVTREEFLNNPELQEIAMQALLEHNKKKLNKFIEKYEGQIVHGVYITESGVLAAAHLAGQGNVKKFFRSGNEFKDGYGTRLTTYMRKFSGYHLDLQ